jgi:hypothetical protein
MQYLFVYPIMYEVPSGLSPRMYAICLLAHGWIAFTASLSCTPNSLA